MEDFMLTDDRGGGQESDIRRWDKEAEAIQRRVGVWGVGDEMGNRSISVWGKGTRED